MFTEITVFTVRPIAGTSFVNVHDNNTLIIDWTIAKKIGQSFQIVHAIMTYNTDHIKQEDTLHKIINQSWHSMTQVGACSQKHRQRYQIS